MMQSTIPLAEIARNLRPILGKKVDALYMQYALSADMDAKREIEQLFHSLYYKYIEHSLLNNTVILEPPSLGHVRGPYVLGDVTYAGKKLYDFSLLEKDMLRHICITGMSGSGKTNLAFNLLTSLIDNKKPFIVFDWKKSFRPLLLVDESILCFTIGSNIANHFKTNINIPPKGVSPREWLTILVDLLIESFGASYGVHKLLTETLDRAYKDFGVYEGSDNYPTWHQIKDRLLEKEAEFRGRKNRESEWLISSLRIAHALTFGEFAEALNHKGEGTLHVEELLDKRILFEMNALGNTEKRFFCSYILAHIYKYKKSQQAQHGFSSAILIDEAHHIFLKQKPTFVQELITEVIYRELREYGIGLICLDQHISKLSEVIPGNSMCNIAFQQMLPQDVEILSGLMQLKEKRKFFTMLPVGSAIVKLAERYFEPFTIQVPLIRLKLEGVDDEFVRRRMAVLISTERDLKRVKKRFDTALHDVERTNEIFKNTGVHTYAAQKEIQSIRKADLNQKQIMFIQFIQKYPQYGTAKVYEALSLSARQGNKIKKELLERGLIKEEEVKSANGWKKVMKPFTHLESSGISGITA